MVNLDVLRQGVCSVLAETKCGIDTDTLYRLGFIVMEDCPEGERNYRDNYELISPIPYPVREVPELRLPLSYVLRTLLYQGYFGNFPLYELPPICYTHLAGDLSEWNDAVKIGATARNVDNIMSLVSKPICTEEELYKAVYSITAIRNELALQACKLLAIKWEPQVSLVNKCFYAASDTPQRAWQDDCNVLQANLSAFRNDVIRLAYTTRVFSEWSKENPKSAFKVSPISILNMTEKEFNALPGISLLYSKAKEKSNSEPIVLCTLDRFCAYIRIVYQRITQVSINPCSSDTVYGKAKWLMQLVSKLTAYMAEQ